MIIVKINILLQTGVGEGSIFEPLFLISCMANDIVTAKRILIKVGKIHLIQYANHNHDSYRRQ